MIAHESCHEMAGKHTCDKRAPLKELKKLFPGVDYSLVVHEEDPLWTSERESWGMVAERALEFMEWLWSRPERCIAVVAHGSFLASLLVAVLHMQGGIQLAFKTAEIRTLTIQTLSDTKRAEEMLTDPVVFNTNYCGKSPVKLLPHNQRWEKRLVSLRIVERQLQSRFQGVS